MNRELKFRAWNGDEMIILENSGLQYYDFEGSYSLGFTVDAYTDFWAHEQYKSATKKASQFPIMQFTGLKDKNGVDIYEGDILNGCVFNGVFCFGKVEFFNGRFCAFPIGTYKEGISDFFYILQHIEVIGNIYQNSELL